MSMQFKTAAFALAFTLLSVPVAQAKGFKVGYVNVQRIVSEVKEAKRARSRLKRDFEKKQKKLDAMQKKFQKRAEDFQKGEAMMKPEVRNKTRAELQQKMTELQQTYMKLQQDLAKKEQQMAQEIYGKIRNLVAAIGDRDGYNLILDNSEAKSTVLYFKRHRDVTDQIIATYNKKFP